MDTMTEQHDAEAPRPDQSPLGAPSQALAHPPVQPAYGPPPQRGASEPFLDRFFGWFRGVGLRRDTSEKWLAGVCSGIARRLGIDPLVVRAGLIVLVLIGGLGITLYLVAWLLLPAEDGDILLEAALRRGDIVGILVLAVVAISIFSGPGLLFGNDGAWWLVGVGVPIAVVIWLFTRRGKDGTPVPVQQSADEAAARARAWGEQVGPQAQAWGEQVGARFSGDRPTTSETTNPTGQETPMTQTASAPTATPPTPTTAYAAPPAYAQPAYGPPAYGPPPTAPVQAPRAPKPPKPHRRRGLGFAGFVLAMGLAVVAFGGAMMLHDAQGWTSDATVIALASALGALALVILVGGLTGRRAGFTGFVAIVVALLTWLAAVTPSLHVADGAGDPTWRPVSTATDTEYDLGFGSATLDLDGLTARSGSAIDAGAIDAEVGVGELRIEVPQDVTVRVVGEVGGGDIEIRQDSEDGFDTTIDSSRGGMDERIDRVFGDGDPTVTVDASVGFGQLVIVQR